MTIPITLNVKNNQQILTFYTKKYITHAYISEAGVDIRFETYGTSDSDVGGTVYVDLTDTFADDPMVYVWSDINEEEPTHEISLNGARLERRKTNE